MPYTREKNEASMKIGEIVLTEQQLRKRARYNDMDRRNDALTREIDIYIDLHMHRDSFKIKDFFDVLGARHATGPSTGGAKWALDFLLSKMELSFSEKLMKIIEKKRCKPAEVYNKAGIAKSVFSKIKSDSDYHPTKETALAFAVALHLNMEETSDLIGRAGYTLSHSSESDLIVEYFIEHRMWNIDEINYQLDFRGHKTLTNWRKTKD